MTKYIVFVTEDKVADFRKDVAAKGGVITNDEEVINFFTKHPTGTFALKIALPDAIDKLLPDVEMRDKKRN